MYKNKGINLDLDNFRAITLISCLGKLFTFILHEGLTFLNNEIALLSFNHNAFRKGNSTTDHLFLPQSFGKHLFVVSLTSARHLTVWRTVSWKIMINSGIKGKIFTVVYNMHDNINYLYNITVNNLGSCSRKYPKICPNIYKICLRTIFRMVLGPS